MNIDQFDFNLPEDLIAQQPVNPRHNSKLLTCINSKLDDFHFYDLPNLLSPGDVIVVNDTKVLKAKLIGLVNEKKISFNLHMKNTEDQWYAFCKPAKKCRKNDEVNFSKSFKAIILEKKDHGEVLLKFNFSGNELLNKISKYGIIPMPPCAVLSNPALALLSSAINEKSNFIDITFSLQQTAISIRIKSIQFIDCMIINFFYLLFSGKG